MLAQHCLLANNSPRNAGEAWVSIALDTLRESESLSERGSDRLEAWTALTMETTVAIDMPRQWYYPGEKIVGTVSLEIAEDPTRFRELDLVVKGIEKSTAGTRRHPATERNEFYRDHVRLASFGDAQTFGRGSKTWTFGITLPADVPPSMKQAIEGRWWKIKYVAEVHLVKGRHLTRVAVKERVAFGVRRLPHDPDQAEAFNKPALAIPRTTPLSRYLALRRGSATVGFWLDRTAYDRGEAIEVVIAVRNDSKFPIQGLTCELVQEAEWVAKNRTERCVRVLRTVDAPRFVLEACLVRSQLDLNSCSRSFFAVRAAAEHQLSGVLQAREGWPLRMTIPDDASYGLDPGNRYVRLGRLITYLQVSLVMDGPRRRPTCRYPITLVPWNTAAPTDSDLKIEEPVAVAVADDDSDAPVTPFVDAVFYLGHGNMEDESGEEFEVEIDIEGSDDDGGVRACIAPQAATAHPGGEWPEGVVVVGESGASVPTSQPSQLEAEGLCDSSAGSSTGD